MSPKFAAALQELRQQRGLLDQAITALEMINGERPLPEVTVTRLVEPERPRKMLTAVRQAKRKYTRRAGAVTAPAATRAVESAPQPKVDGRASSTAVHDAAAIAALKKHGDMAPDALRKVLGINDETGRALFARLKRLGRVAVIGAGRGTRYALPKEAP